MAPKEDATEKRAKREAERLARERTIQEKREAREKARREVEEARK